MRMVTGSLIPRLWTEALFLAGFRRSTARSIERVITLSDTERSSAKAIGGFWSDQPVLIGGQRYCRTCHEEGHQVPNRQDRPNSPYCLYHFNRARSEAKRRAREKGKARADALERASRSRKTVHVEQDGRVVLGVDGGERLRGDLAKWQDTVQEVIETLRFAGGGGDGGVMLRRAAEALDVVASGAAGWSEALAPDDPS